MSRTPASHDLTRRHMLGRSAALLAGVAAGGGVISVARGARAATSEVTFQLGWIMSNGQIGAEWHVAATGDFFGTGRDAILWESDSGDLQSWS